MKKADVISHYGTMAAAARALGITKQAVFRWGPVVPERWAARISLQTHGELRYDPNEYAPSGPARN